jgi:hypothetical protein
MGLPSNPRPSETVTIGQVDIDIRGLHLFQIRDLAKMDQDQSDATAIAWATGCTPEEATDWIEQSAGGDAVQLLAAIMRTSGWDPDAAGRFPQ